MYTLGWSLPLKDIRMEGCVCMWKCKAKMQKHAKFYTEKIWEMSCDRGERQWEGVVKMAVFSGCPL